MSVSLADLEKQLRAVTKSGKYVVGGKEVLNSLKGSKLVVWSASANVPAKILDECKNLQVPALRFGGSSIELGRTCGIPFKVSVIAVKSAGDAVLSPFQNSKDYSRPGVVVQMAAKVPAVKGEELGKVEANQKLKAPKNKEEGEPKPKKSARGKTEKEKKDTKKDSKKGKKKDQETEPNEGEEQ